MVRTAIGAMALRKTTATQKANSSHFQPPSLTVSNRNAAPADGRVRAPLEIAALKDQASGGEKHQRQRQRRGLRPARRIAPMTP